MLTPRSLRNHVPPRKTTKRPAQIIEKDVDKPIKKKKAQEVHVTPNLRAAPPGVVLTFGQGDVGQLGLGEDVMEKLRPATVPNYPDIISIAAGGMHNVCVTATGQVLTFGCNDEGALGRDTSKEGSETVPGVVDLPGKAIQVTAGDSHSAALLDDGRVFAWGSFRDSHGSMGLTTRGMERLPIAVLPTVRIVKIASGADHLVMLTETGLLYTSGCAEQGQLGRVPSRTADRHCRQGIAHLLTPNLVVFKVGKKILFNDIWAGQYCTFAKECEKGEIYVFGLNNYYQIGLEDTVPYYHPQVSKTFNGKDWVHISGGQHHTVALDAEEHVYVLGRKEYGRLGLGPDCSDAQQLIHVEAVSQPVRDVATGSAQSFAVTHDGQLYAWGMGTSGQLGTGEEEDVFSPVLIKGKQLEKTVVHRVAGGGQHTIILGVPTDKLC